MAYNENGMDVDELIAALTEARNRHGNMPIVIRSGRADLETGIISVDCCDDEEGHTDGGDYLAIGSEEWAVPKVACDGD